MGKYSLPPRISAVWVFTPPLTVFLNNTGCTGCWEAVHEGCWCLRTSDICCEPTIFCCSAGGIVRRAPRWHPSHSFLMTEHSGSRCSGFSHQESWYLKQIRLFKPSRAVISSRIFLRNNLKPRKARFPKNRAHRKIEKRDAKSQSDPIKSSGLAVVWGIGSHPNY